MKLKLNICLIIVLITLVQSQNDEINNDSSNLHHLQTSIKQQNNFYTAKVGDTLVIPCEIENRKQATVIWQYSKSRIPETLAIGYFYFRKDFRIRVIANATTEKEQSWNLEVRRVRLEDEGYYLCKVMTESESLKRVVYLRVEVDMTISPLNPIVNPKDSITIYCNTSFVQNETLKVAKSSHNHPSSNYRLIWYKDGIVLSPHDHTGSHLKHNNTTSLNYKIDYFTKPKLASKLKITSFNPANVGVYTCRFRQQNVSTTVTSKSYLNKQLLEYETLNSISASSILCSITTLKYWMFIFSLTILTNLFI